MTTQSEHLEEKTIKVRDRETVQRFEKVKKHIGVRNDIEVLRVLLKFYMREEMGEEV